ncbi:MAG: CidA/LrgA family protein [Burkholderiales bacterium]|nr:MAG: CidA/LrgA family protein [Burkholderiales bacterium]
MIRTLSTLLVFQCVGEIASFGLALPVPGPVIGMALLVLYLMLRPGAESALREPSLELLRHLSLLFVPAGVGVMLHAGRLSDELWPILIALVASTALAIVATALAVSAAQRWLARRCSRG